MEMLSNYQRMTREFRKFWMQAQRRIGTTRGTIAIQTDRYENPKYQKSNFKKYAPVKENIKKKTPSFEDYKCFIGDLASNRFSVKATSP